MSDINAFLAAQLVKPMTHKVITLYADGAIKTHETRSAAAAENWATGECRKIGRNLIDRATGKTVRVVSVEVVAL